jgi:hypothetical protein
MGGESANRKVAGAFFLRSPELGVMVRAVYLSVPVSPQCSLCFRYPSKKLRDRTLI